MDYMKHKIILIIFSLFLLALLAGCSSNVEQQVLAKPLFPERHGWDLKKISIAGDGTTLNFKRVNCVWVVGDDNEPSDESRVTTLAEKLVSIAPQELPSLGPDRYRDFKVGDDSFSRKVILTFKDNNSYTLLIGTPGITKPVYLRLADRKELYSIDEPSFKQINMDLDSWLTPKEG